MKNSIFSNRKTAPFWAFFCAAGWSLAYPLIKLGYAQLHIASDDLGSKIGFAGIRFLFAGILVTILAIIQKRKFKVEQKSVVAWLLLFALVNTALHYLFSYVGLGYLPSSRSTILDSMNGFFAIILSCIIFEDDKFSKFKALGCILGFGGILLINIEPGQNFFQGISFRGDGMILLNALCGAFGGIITRIISKKMDMTVATGLSMTIGGGLLCIISVIIGPASKWTINIKSIITMVGLILISAVCFGVYNQLLAYHPISKIAIFNAFIPILGVIFSSIILGEPMRIKYIIAGCMVAFGVYIMNHFSE
ncbi:DMT family transporter [Eubacterium ventriosum]|jgi:drug/metabolite transporter (DMT)-like permease|uniref:DMT family transporter n=1 Tax=Eubacterium ventriosum TaxID=39496 RepID=UPI002E7924CA|nr:DMT family transporter [Eubacterium ventriosum]MEE0854211.1 DMT family transporter [Eubacterium ventriosum]